MMEKQLRNKWIVSSELTDEQKEIASDYITGTKTLADVEEVYFQVKKDGTLDHVSINYYDDGSVKTEPDMIDGMNLLFAGKHSKEYQAAKKTTSASNEQINNARRILGAE